MGDPEHIGEILKRVFKELDKQYNGGCLSSDREREPIPPDPPFSRIGGEDERASRTIFQK